LKRFLGHSRPQMNDNRNLSIPYQLEAFSQHQGQDPDRAQSLMEPAQRGKKEIVHMEISFF